MTEHLPGIVILAVSVVLVVLAVVARFVSYRRRWSFELAAGVACRVARGATVTPFSLEECSRAIRAIADRADAGFPGTADNLGIELVPRGGVRTSTVPTGYLPDGRLVRASVRVERMFPLPWAAKRYVAVVEADPDAVFALIVHEWARHLLPLRLGQGLDPLHLLDRFEAVEQQTLRHFRR